ncbi:helix-turn-helix transcriptional regulator [Komagataeibacter rhaeticus]|uniref:helix-turn-helix transcriptional regulator n=1 Tax=Komagataeibacter rhaeticus TaxID=215221 RepID=UPI0002F3AE64|nr:helix-turn-helix transcriptional regulator [Komagataeibacter rhaeticus]WPP23202.1 helix-turn-helix transcriptional regulator [Komagataeibacter rhaeticus]
MEGQMQAWKFNLAQQPDQDPATLWQEVMARLFLPAARPLEPQTGFFGSATRLVSPLGIELTRLTSAPQQIAGRYVRQSDGIWLAQILDGHGTLATSMGDIALRTGDVAFGPVATHTVLTLPVEFSLLYVRLPRLALHPRLLGPMPVRVGMLTNTQGIQQVFSDTLCSLGRALDHLTLPQLRAVELVLSELLISSVLSDEASSLGSSASSRRIALFHRLCQTVEAELADPDLNVQKIAKLQGISSRTLQKLFSMAGRSFSQYIRMRRLERCRGDLASPLYTHLSISEICFRWGFNDAAHFSRTFRQSYDMTPREWRNANHAAVDDKLNAHPVMPAAVSLAR